MANLLSKTLKKPIFVSLFVRVISVITGLTGVAGLVLSALVWIVPGIAGFDRLQFSQIQVSLGVFLAGFLLTVIAQGTWRYKNWARTLILFGLMGFVIYEFVVVVFAIFSSVFAGEAAVSLASMLVVFGKGMLYFLLNASVPGLLAYALIKIGQYFEESPRQRDFVDRILRYVFLGTALSSIVIVILIFLFTMIEAWPSVTQIGLDTMLFGTIWRPGSIIGNDTAQFGLLPMIVGSILSTFGAILIGVPLSIGTAILLAEVAPRAVRVVLRPAVELLAGIPSVVYGLFGMVVLAPIIRNIEVPRNSGFGLLNASIILAVMIIPTVTNIAEDAIRAVPREYKEGSLALGGSHWQTIVRVILPASRSGIIAAIILGVGRALGETMAMIMVIGNSIAMPSPLTGNPLTLFLNTARTLTGNIAVEINYAAGAHRSALFFTGVLLFIMIMLVNSTARFFMRSRQEQ